MSAAAREPARIMVRVLIVGATLVAAILAAAFRDDITASLQLRALAVPVGAVATAAAFPCPLPPFEGARSIAAIDYRGGIYHLTCSGTRPLIQPIAKGAK